MWTRTRICGNRKIVAFPQDQAVGQWTDGTMPPKCWNSGYTDIGQFPFISSPYMWYWGVSVRCIIWSATVDGKSPLPCLKNSIKIVMGLRHW